MVIPRKGGCALVVIVDTAWLTRTPQLLLSLSLSLDSPTAGCSRNGFPADAEVPRNGVAVVVVIAVCYYMAQMVMLLACRSRTGASRLELRGRTEPLCHMRLDGIEQQSESWTTPTSVRQTMRARSEHHKGSKLCTAPGLSPQARCWTLRLSRI